ncbi:hypothetical protein Pelo_18808 [Pelomyxa schiedti]|nr:hypothetical protein Pelo_18808 [Pelomyxa schiedti]
MLTPSNEEEFVMGGDNNNPVLRARDQLGALASAWRSSSVATDEIATTTTSTTLVPATEGHVVARLVWDLVASTARPLLVRVIGRDYWGMRASDSSLCVRVSPLLLSVVGEIRYRPLVDDTREEVDIQCWPEEEG